MHKTILATSHINNHSLIEWFNQGRVWIISLFTFSILFVASWFIDHKNNQAYYQSARAEAQTKLGTIRAHLEGELNSNIQTVYGLIAALSVEPDMDQARFAKYVEPLLERDNQLKNIAAAPDMVISLMYPIKGNEAAIGLNYLKNDKQRSAAVIARDTGQLVLAGPINLLQGGQGFIGRIPVYTEKNGSKQFWGLVSAVIDTKRLYEASGLLDENLSLDIAIFGQDKRFSNGSIFYGPEIIFTQKPVIGLIELPYGSWQVAGIPKGGWPKQAGDAKAFRLILFLVCLCIFLPIVLVTRLTSRHRDQQLKIDALFQLSPISITLTEVNTGNFLMANPKFCSETGYTQAELSKMTHWDISPETSKKQYKKQLNNLKEQGYFEPFEDRYITKSGNSFPAATNGVQIKDSSGRELLWSYIENIQEKKQHELDALESANQLELVIQATQVGIWDWQIQTGKLTLNERWAEMLGYNLEELGNISIKTWMRLAHPDDLEQSELLMEEHWNGKSDSYIYEVRMKHKKGHYIWVLNTGKVIEKFEDGRPKRMVGTHLDITDKKMVEKEVAQTNSSLAKQMKLIKTMVKTQSAFISQNDSHHEFTDLLNDLMSLANCQHAFIGMISNENETLTFSLEKYYYKNITIEDENYFKNLDYSKYKTDNPRNLLIKTASLASPIYMNEYDEMKISSLFPKEHPALSNILIIPVKNQYETIAIIGLANRDTKFNKEVLQWLTPLINSVSQILESLKNRDEKKQAELLLIEAKNEAESAGNAKTEFLATMSHEIRTPMNGVVGMLNLLQKSDLNKEQAHKVEMARYSADTLLTIINDILDFTKIDSGKLKIEKTSFNIRNLVDEACQSLALKSQEKGIELILDLSDLKHTQVISDPVRIRQVLINLLGNANKFTEKGEIIVEAKTKIKGNDLIFSCSITDSGIGVEKENLNHLFDSFTQADASTTRKFGGTGLGLSISKRICELMNGYIWVTSKVNKGSCFSFEIPIGNQHISEPISLPNNFDSLNILFIDKNKKVCESVSKQLKAWGNNTAYFTDFEEAKKSINSETNYDIIFIDHYIQQDFESQIISLSEHTHIGKPTKWILMTHVNQIIPDDKIKSIGFDSSFTKPITTQNLLNGFSLLTPKDSIEIKNNQLINKQLPKDKKVLLVEDIPFNQEVASMLLAEMGINCEIANNGLEAVNMTLEKCSKGDCYDAILMDCQMPIKDGYDATREIKHYCTDKALDIPIIAMTANAMSGDQEKCFSAGMDDYLSKPIDEDKLFTTLLKWLDRC